MLTKRPVRAVGLERKKQNSQSNLSCRVWSGRLFRNCSKTILFTRATVTHYLRVSGCDHWRWLVMTPKINQCQRMVKIWLTIGLCDKQSATVHITNKKSQVHICDHSRYWLRRSTVTSECYFLDEFLRLTMKVLKSKPRRYSKIRYQEYSHYTVLCLVFVCVLLGFII